MVSIVFPVPQRPFEGRNNVYLFSSSFAVFTQGRSMDFFFFWEHTKLYFFDNYVLILNVP
jgi:hypothetical protein